MRPPVLVLVALLGLLGLSLGIKTRSVPAEGLYVTVRNDVIAQIAETISLGVADVANNDNNFPPYTGQSGSAKYTFSNFAFDVNLQGFSFFPANPPSLNFGWDTFDFIFQFNFHICDTNFPFPCDSGVITIWTTNDIKIQVTGQLLLSGPTISYSSSGVSLIFNQGDIYINVDCTDVVCLIPVSDIANAVAQNFVPTFQNGMQQFIEQSASTYLNTIATTITVPELSLDLILNGGFTFYPPNAAVPNIVFYLDGLFVPENGQSKRPPFNPTVSPPDSIFLNPSSQVDFVLTDYIFQTALWALDQNGDFDMTITPKDVPSNSPVQLSTNDGFFLSAVPGLSKYPNMNITITTALITYSTVDVSTSGVGVTAQVMASFTLTNKTTVVPAFALAITLDVVLGLTTNQSASGQIGVYASLTSLQSSVSVAKTNVGTVATSPFQAMIELVVSFDPPKIPPIELPVSSQYFAVSSPSIALNTGFLEERGNVKITYPVQSIPCTSTFACPVQTTCCNWNNGWGCCTLPSATCCQGAGCCPSGWQCAGGGCEQGAQRIEMMGNHTRSVFPPSRGARELLRLGNPH